MISLTPTSDAFPVLGPIPDAEPFSASGPSAGVESPADSGPSTSGLPADCGPLTLIGVRGAPAGFAVELAATARRRMRGWLGRSAPPPGLGIWLLRCDAVHTFTMRFAIDLIFVDADGRILRIDHRVRPWRLAFCIGAYSVIELAATEAARLGLAVGDHLEVRGE